MRSAEQYRKVQHSDQHDSSCVSQSPPMLPCVMGLLTAAKLGCGAHSPSPLTHRPQLTHI